MSTASMGGVLAIIRNRLLTFTSAGGGPTLASLIGSTASGAGSDGKLYVEQGPDDLTGFWGILHLIDLPQQGLDGGFMLRGQVELILYGRPRKQMAAVNRMADLVTEAWMNWLYSETNGHISGMDITSRFPIPYQEPADRELVAIRMILPFRCTPLFLTQYSG